MKLEPNKTYKVIKENTDRSILIGDLIYLDGRYAYSSKSKRLARERWTNTACYGFWMCTSLIIQWGKNKIIRRE